MENFAFISPLSEIFVTSLRYNDNLLNGYVVTLQKFEELLRQEVANGNVNITESTIETDNIFKL